MILKTCFNYKNIDTEDVHSVYNFFKICNFELFEITSTVREEWSRVIQENHKFDFRNQEYRQELIEYMKGKYKNEVNPGLINIMSVLCKILEKNTKVNRL